VTCLFLLQALHDRVSSTGNNSPKLSSRHHAFVFADLVPLFSDIFRDHINPHFPTFSIAWPRPPQNASGFLQVSLSKIRGYIDVGCPVRGSPRISDQR